MNTSLKVFNGIPVKRTYKTIIKISEFLTKDSETSIFTYENYINCLRWNYIKDSSKNN